MTVALPSPPVVPRPTVTISGTYPAGFTLSFPTTADTNVTYYLEYTTDLAGETNWTTIASTPGTGATADLQDLNPSDQQRFYRIRMH